MKQLFWYIIGGVLSIYLSVLLIDGVFLEIVPGQNVFFGLEFTEQWQLLIIVGGILGLINLIIKPILSVLALPLKILTLGLFPLILNMTLLWILDLLFLEFKIIGLIPLFLAALISLIINFLLRLKK